MNKLKTSMLYDFIIDMDNPEEFMETTVNNNDQILELSSDERVELFNELYRKLLISDTSMLFSGKSRTGLLIYYLLVLLDNTEELSDKRDSLYEFIEVSLISEITCIISNNQKFRSNENVHCNIRYTKLNTSKISMTLYNGLSDDVLNKYIKEDTIIDILKMIQINVFKLIDPSKVKEFISNMTDIASLNIVTDEGLVTLSRTQKINDITSVDEIPRLSAIVSISDIMEFHPIYKFKVMDILLDSMSNNMDGGW